MKINQYDKLEEVTCCKCDTTFKVHPMQNINSTFIIDCEMHNIKNDSSSKDLNLDAIKTRTNNTD